MLTGEMTDRDLLGWIEMKLNRRIQVLAGLNATDNATFMATEDDSALIRIGARIDERCSQIADLESLRNNLKLGLRCIDGELPQLNDRPWEEADEDEDGPRAVAEVVAWDTAGVACVVDDREAIAEGDHRYYDPADFDGPTTRLCRDCNGRGFISGDVDCRSCGGCGSVPGEPSY